MSSENFERPGYPGDGDHSIELHHDAPAEWTAKTNTWAVTIIILGTILAIAAIILAVHSNK